MFPTVLVFLINPLLRTCAARVALVDLCVSVCPSIRLSIVFLYVEQFKCRTCIMYIALVES